VRVLSRLFRRLFLTRLAAAHAAGRLVFFGELDGRRGREAFAAYLAPLRRKNWFVYAKPPFAGPEAGLAYLARYTHRVAIANRRLVALDERGVTFRYKDYYKDYRQNRQAGAVPHHDARAQRVHQALPAPRSAEGVPSHPPLRIARQRHLQGQHRARQRTDRRASGSGGSAGTTRRGPGRQRRSRPSPAMPLLRRPHDHRRELWARRRTPRPAIA